MIKFTSGDLLKCETHDKDKVIAAIRSATDTWTEDTTFIERFYAIAFEDGRKAEREERIDAENSLADYLDGHTDEAEAYVDPDANKTPAQLRIEGRAYCPKCYTFGYSHSKDCPYKNEGMANHIRARGDSK